MGTREVHVKNLRITLPRGQGRGMPGQAEALARSVAASLHAALQRDPGPSGATGMRELRVTVPRDAMRNPLRPDAVTKAITNAMRTARGGSLT